MQSSESKVKLKLPPNGLLGQLSVVNAKLQVEQVGFVTARQVTVKGQMSGSTVYAE